MTQPPSSSGPLAPPPSGGWNQADQQPGSGWGQAGGQPGGGMPPSGGGAPQPGGWNQPAAAPAKKKSKVPMVLIILGIVILALSVIGGIVMAVLGFTGASSDLEVISGTGSVEAEADDVLQLYAKEGETGAMCSVTGPSPSALGEGTDQTSTITQDGITWISVDSFTAKETGTYEFDCAGDEVAVGPPVSGGAIVAGIGGIFLAIAGGAVGLLLVVTGVIILLVRRSRA